MERIIVQYLPEIESQINDLSILLFEKDYFAFYEFAENYVDKLTFFIENEINTFPHKTTPKKLKKNGSYYVFYKANSRTTWYIFFEKNGNKILITYISNNHIQEMSELQY